MILTYNRITTYQKNKQTGSRCNVLIMDLCSQTNFNFLDLNVNQVFLCSTEEPKIISIPLEDLDFITSYSESITHMNIYISNFINSEYIIYL